MTVDDRLRAAAEDTRRRIEGLTLPRFWSKRLRPSALRWVTAMAAVLILAATIWPHLYVEPPFDVKPGEVLLSIDPPVVRGALGPAPQFDTNLLGRASQLREVEKTSDVANRIRTDAHAGLVKVTFVGITELGSIAAFLDSSHLPCIWIETRSGKSCSVITGGSEIPSTISRGLSGAIAWGPLPDEASVIVLEYDGMKLWQRPVAGIVLFDTDMRDGDEYVLTALDASGETILTETAVLFSDAESR